MEIVHIKKNENNENAPFSISYGDRVSDPTLLNLEKTLLTQMGNILSIIRGGEYKKRKSHVSA